MYFQNGSEILSDNKPQTYLIAYNNTRKSIKDKSDRPYTIYPLKNNIADARNLLKKGIIQIDQIYSAIDEILKLAQADNEITEPQIQTLINKINSLANAEIQNGVVLFDGSKESAQLIIRTGYKYDSFYYRSQRIMFKINGLTSDHLDITYDRLIKSKAEENLKSTLIKIKFIRASLESMQKRLNYSLEHIVILDKYKFTDKGLHENQKRLLETATGSLKISYQMIIRIKSLAQASLKINDYDEKMILQCEVSQLVGEVDRIAEATDYNNMTLLTGSFASYYSGGGCPTASMWFQLNNQVDNRTLIHIGTFTSASLGLRKLNVMDNDVKYDRITCESALQKIDKQLIDLQAYSRRLGFVEELNKKQKKYDYSGVSTESRELDTLLLNKLLLKTAYDSLAEIELILNRCRELAAETIKNNSENKMIAYAVEVSQLFSEIDRIATSASFNHITILTGRFSENMQNSYKHMGHPQLIFQKDEKKSGRVQVFIGDMSAHGLGLHLRYSIDDDISINKKKITDWLGIVNKVKIKVKTQRLKIKEYYGQIKYSKKYDKYKPEPVNETGPKFELINTALDSLPGIKNQLFRLQELAAYAAQNTYSSSQRKDAMAQYEEIVSSIDEIAQGAVFNKMTLLTGRFANPAYGGMPTASMWYHVGLNNEPDYRLFIGTMTAQGLGLWNNSKKGISITDLAGEKLHDINRALQKLEKQTDDLKAYKQRVKYSTKQLKIFQATDPGNINKPFVKQKLFLQRADNSLELCMEILNRMREIAVKASDCVYTVENRMSFQVEVSQMIHEIYRIATSTEFNGRTLFTGTFADYRTGSIPAASMWFYTGKKADKKQNHKNRCKLYIDNMTSIGLGLNYLSVSSPESANAGILQIDSALRKLKYQRKIFYSMEQRRNYYKEFNKIYEETESSPFMTEFEKMESGLKRVDNVLELNMKLLDQLKQLARKSINGVYTLENRTFFNITLSELIMEYDSIIEGTDFNNQTLLTGRFASVPWKSINGKTKINFNSIAFRDLDSNNKYRISISSMETAESALRSLEEVQEKLSLERKRIQGYIKELPKVKKGVEIKIKPMPIIESKDFLALKGIGLALEGIKDYLEKIEGITRNGVNSYYTYEDRLKFESECMEHFNRIKEIPEKTKYNGKYILKGDRIILKDEKKNEIIIQLEPLDILEVNPGNKLISPQGCIQYLWLLKKEINKIKADIELIKYYKMQYTFRSRFHWITKQTSSNSKERMIGYLNLIKDILKETRTVSIKMTGYIDNWDQRIECYKYINILINEIKFIKQLSQFNNEINDMISVDKFILKKTNTIMASWHMIYDARNKIPGINEILDKIENMLSEIYRK